MRQFKRFFYFFTNYIALKSSAKRNKLIFNEVNLLPKTDLKQKKLVGLKTRYLLKNGATFHKKTCNNKINMYYYK